MPEREGGKKGTCHYREGKGKDCHFLAIDFGKKKRGKEVYADRCRKKNSDASLPASLL